MTEPNKMPDEIWACQGLPCWEERQRQPDMVRYVRADNPPTVTADEAREALDALNGLAFSDGAGAVCRWVNAHQTTIRRCISHFIPEGE